MLPRCIYKTEVAISDFKYLKMENFLCPGAPRVESTSTVCVVNYQVLSVMLLK